MTESPTSAPQDKLNKNLIKVSKHLMLQYFLAQTRTRAAKNPIDDIPIPASTPKPHICAWLRVG